MGSGIRARRRSSGLNEWAIYSLAYAIDESVSGTSGTFSIRSSYYKRAASAYTVDTSTGQVSLTNSTQKTAANLAVGDYIVNISTSSSTATTGTKLYKITSKSGSNTITFGYEAFKPSKIAKGTDTGERITSKNQDYPIDGKQGDNWYVMIAGSYTAYVWDIYNCTYRNGYKEKTTNIANSWLSDCYASKSYSFDIITGLYTLIDPVSVHIGSGDDITTAYNNGYYLIKNTKSGEIMYKYNYLNETDPYHSTLTRYTAVEDESIQVPGGKGEATGNTVESYDISAYPQDGLVGDFWYEYVRSYKKRI